MTPSSSARSRPAITFLAPLSEVMTSAIEEPRPFRMISAPHPPPLSSAHCGSFAQQMALCRADASLLKPSAHSLSIAITGGVFSEVRSDARQELGPPQVSSCPAHAERGRVISCTSVRSPSRPPWSLVSWLGAIFAQRRSSERARTSRRLSGPRSAAPSALARSEWVCR